MDWLLWLAYQPCMYLSRVFSFYPVINNIDKLLQVEASNPSIYRDTFTASFRECFFLLINHYVYSLHLQFLQALQEIKIFSEKLLV